MGTTWMIFAVAALATLPAIAQTPPALPDGDGKAIVQKICVGCHGLEVITAKHATPEQWAGLVQQMVSRGADGTDAEIEAVTRYLSVSFPPVKDDKVPAPPPAPSLNPRFYATIR